MEEQEKWIKVYRFKNSMIKRKTVNGKKTKTNKSGGRVVRFILRDRTIFTCFLIATRWEGRAQSQPVECSLQFLTISPARLTDLKSNSCWRIESSIPFRFLDEGNRKKERRIGSGLEVDRNCDFASYRVVIELFSDKMQI